METLFAKHDLYYSETTLDIVRDFYDEIDWEARLIALVGPKGVGKSTLLLRYIKHNYPAHSRKVLYCSMDSLYFSTHTIMELVERFVIMGGELLVLDEIHKYSGKWGMELKEVYDLYPRLKVVISGSSLLKIINSEADLSRRCVRYEIQGLSFREYLRIYHGLKFDKVALSDIIDNPFALADTVTAKCRPMEFFKDYLKFGYYPFYLEGAKSYYRRIEQAISYTLEVEIPELKLVDISGVLKLKKLLYMISDQVPFELDSSKLARAIEASRETVVLYLYHLGKAKLLNLLFSEKKSYAKLAKPDKLYLENTNMLYALSGSQPEIGTVRETFAVSHLMAAHTVEYGKEKGDFKVDGKYTFEVGGADKGFSQIAGVENAYVLADDIEMPSDRKVPLWMIGFLY